MQVTSIDDAAWTSPWRARATGDKALLALGLVLTALCLPPWPTGVLVGLAAVLALLGPARIPPGTLVQAMGPPLTVILLGALPLFIEVGSPGGDGWNWGLVSTNPAAWHRGADVVNHGVAGSLAVMVLAMTTPMVDLLTFARRLRVPDVCLDIASLTYRFVFLLLDSALTIAAAQRGRLGDAPARRRTGSRTRARFDATAGLTSTVLLRSWERARRLSEGLTGRGYDTALVTLPTARARSLPFEAMTLTLLVGLWVGAAVVRP